MSKNYKYADIPWSELYTTAFAELIYILMVVWFILVILTIAVPIMIIARGVYFIHCWYKTSKRYLSWSN